MVIMAGQLTSQWSMNIHMPYRSPGIGVVAYTTGAPCYIEIPPWSPGKVLSKMLQERTGIPVKLQMLVHGGKVVNPEISLTSQDFVHGSSVFVHIRSKGGGKTKDSSTKDTPSVQGTG